MSDYNSRIKSWGAQAKPNVNDADKIARLLGAVDLRFQNGQQPSTFEPLNEDEPVDETPLDNTNTTTYHNRLHNLEGLAHLTKQAQSVGKVHDDMTSSMVSRRTSSPPDSTLSKLNSTLPTPEQTQASAQKGGQ
ncbi:hypothetical protein KCU73_g13418, partial [Aureobasidium melanogenum]